MSLLCSYLHLLYIIAKENIENITEKIVDIKLRYEFKLSFFELIFQLLKLVYLRTKQKHRTIVRNKQINNSSY